MKTGTEVSETLIERVEQWLEQAALDGAEIETIVAGTCERLAAAGVPLTRVHLSFSMLHPLYDAIGFTWLRGGGLTIEGFRGRQGDSNPERFLNSPYYYLLQHKMDYLRRRIAPAETQEFPVFEDLLKLGITDYLAFVQSFGDSAGRGMLGSWSTDLPGGFPDQTIEALLHVQRKLAVTAKMALLSKLANNMLSTYLGESAGARVLSGQTRRGDAETIRAVLVMADMRESTPLAEKSGRASFVETLNEFFEAIAAPFNEDGGEILSFIGDGFLAVYPCERHAEPSQRAAKAAMAATQRAIGRMAELNRSRAEEGLEPISFGIGLHVGNVIFGNVGLKKRLTFSAFGPAVNEVQRLEALTKRYGVPVVASEIFTSYCGGDWKVCGEETLPGVGEKFTIYAPRPVAATEPVTAQTERPATHVAQAEAASENSEAEQVMILFRDRSGPQGKGPDRRAS